MVRAARARRWRPRTRRGSGRATWSSRRAPGASPTGGSARWGGGVPGGGSPRGVLGAHPALYDLGFSYEDGDPARPRVSAGQALRGLVRAFFTYRGSFFWRMQAGMGDVVFAPFYEALRRRGVRFEFFRRLENVSLVDPAR